MIGILIVSHEPLGTALLRCTRHVFGRLPPQLAALDVIPDEDTSLAEKAARELLARINDGSGVIVFTDCLGATPSRIAMRLAEPLRTFVVTGVNLPMLLKAITRRREPIGQVVDELIAGGHAAIQRVEPEKPEVS
jgi:mannose PTS system EIIA component